jgi:long-chain acyl-CoA synthetase
MFSMSEPTLIKIVENFHARGNEIAYVYRSGYRVQRWSYRQIAEAANSLALELKARGISPCDKVFLWGEDCPEWVVSFFGCILCGAVVVPMDRAATLEFARNVCRQVDARICLCSREMPAVDPQRTNLTFEVFPELFARHSGYFPTVQVPKGDDAAEIVFTSGATGDPKGVVISHRNILANLGPLEREIGKYLKYERPFHPLRFLNLLPLSHVFGQLLGLFIPQILGGTVVFQQSLNPSEILATIRREKVSVLVTVPRVLDTIRAKLERDLEATGRLTRFQKNLEKACGEHFLLRWWRFRSIHRQLGWKFWAFISGGASLSSESEEFWEALGYAVIQGYGLTETTSLISVNHPFRLGKGSIGQVLAGREVKLSEDGEILVRGDNIAASYHQEGEFRPVVADEGWFHTGDVGTLDEKGNLYFKGRSKNVIVSPEGMNIYPQDLESALRRQHEVRDCVVIGIDHDGNAAPCAVLILRDKDLDPMPAVQRANETLAEFQRIRYWLVWPDEDFPRTPTQKPQFSRIKEVAGRQLAGHGDRKAADGVLADLIEEISGRTVDRIAHNADLTKDLNLSSIERVELLSALEDRLQMDLDESLFTAANTVRELEDLLKQPAQRSNFRYPRWAQRAPVRILRLAVYYLLTWPATYLMAGPRISGRENLQGLRGPCLFISNHITQVDAGYILAALPARFRHWLAVAMHGEMIQDMRKPPAGMSISRKWVERLSYFLVTTLFNVFPLPQKSGYRESFTFAGESVDRGYSILVFPEGTRTRTGEMGPFRAGIGVLSMNLGIPVVPVRIDGLYPLKQAGKKFAPPGTVRVTIGVPVRYAKGADPTAIARDLEKRICS